MRTLIIYMSPNMTTHDMVMHDCFSLKDSDNTTFFSERKSSYKSYFTNKKCAKLILLETHTDDATGQSIVVESESFEHPLKAKIVINRPVAKAFAPTLGAEHFPEATFTPPTQLPQVASTQGVDLSTQSLWATLGTVSTTTAPF